MKTFLELTKPGITRLVVLTATAGFVLGTTGEIDLGLLVSLLVGTGLVASGTNALNQWWERDVDALMRRTRHRPLPSGRIGQGPALVFGAGLAAVGCAELFLLVNPLTALLAFLTVVSYVLVYTPLKRKSPLATIVGSFPGALPILGGWTAARDALSLEGWVLFNIMFLWQVPHFLALGWMYREDYRRGGLKMLSVIDPTGGSSGRQALLYALALLPASLMPGIWGLTGAASLIAGSALGALLVGTAYSFAREATSGRARRLFLASLAYLPLLLGVMIVERLAA